MPVRTCPNLPEMLVRYAAAFLFEGFPLIKKRQDRRSNTPYDI